MTEVLEEPTTTRFLCSPATTRCRQRLQSTSYKTAKFCMTCSCWMMTSTLNGNAHSSNPTHITQF